MFIAIKIIGEKIALFTEKCKRISNKIIYYGFRAVVSKAQNTTNEMTKKKYGGNDTFKDSMSSISNPNYEEFDEISESQKEVIPKENKTPPPVAPRTLLSLFISAMKDYNQDPEMARKKWLPNESKPN